MAMCNASWGTWNIYALASALCIGFGGSALAYEATLSGPLDEELAAELEGGSLLIEQSLLEETPDVREIVSSAQADYRRLLAVLYSKGYFGPTIEIKLDGREAASILAVTPPARVSKATISVDPGRQFRFGTVEISPLSQSMTLPDALKNGETASITSLQSAAASAVSGWRDEGHAKAEVTEQQITARHRSAEIDAKVRIDPGPKLTFGALRVRGESAVRRERIIEIAGLPEGEQFSPEEIKDAAARLRRSGAFRSVAMIEGEVSDTGDTLPINLRVADNKPRRLGFGGEFATIEGVTLSGFWLHRNIFGGAESLRFDAEIGGIGGDTGGIDYLLGTRFERPATFRKDINFFALGEVEQEDEPNYFSRRVSVGAGFTYFATDEHTYRFGLGFSRAITEDAFGDSDYTIFLLPVGATYDYRNNELDARRGFYADAKLTPFVAIAGTDNGLLSELDFRTYLTAGETSPTTLALRAQLGSLVGPSLRDAPADFLFYSGGGGTVRGQDFESLGVDVGGGDIVGGRSFLGLSAEVRLRTTGSLGYVGFVDAGYIGEESFPDGSGEWHSGAGIGIRYETPIGPLRFDVGVPTSGDTDGENFQLYFGIGHSF